MSTEPNVAATTANPDTAPADEAVAVAAAEAEAVAEVEAEPAAPEPAELAAVEPVIEPVSDPVSESGVVTISVEELNSLRAMAAQFQALEAAEKAALVKALSAHANVKNVLTAEALGEKSTSDLQCLAKIVGLSTTSAPAPAAVVNFSLVRPLASADPDSADAPAPDPKPWSTALVAKGLKAVS